MTELLLAHGGVVGGANVDALMIAAALVVVGVTLFVQKSAKPIVSVLLVLGGGTLTFAAFTFLSTDDRHAPKAAPAADPVGAGVVEGLCEARQQLEGDRPAEAESTFYDRSHVPLHDIADRLSGEDTAAAARLLEAKQSVESNFERSTTNVFVLRALDELIISTVRGLAELDQQVQGCA